MTTIGFLALSLGLVVALSWLWWRFEYSYAKRKRAGWTVDHFAHQLPEVTARELIEKAYRYFQRCERHHDFPVSATDKVSGYYALDDEDLIEAVKELAGQCGLQAPTNAEASQVATVGDVVLLLSRQPRETNASPGSD